jgi:hypothetical protein
MALATQQGGRARAIIARSAESWGRHITEESLKRDHLERTVSYDTPARNRHSRGGSSYNELEETTAKTLLLLLLLLFFKGHPDEAEYLLTTHSNTYVCIYIYLLV